MPGDDWAAAIDADVDVTAYTVAELDEIAATGRSGPPPAQGRHRAVPWRRARSTTGPRSSPAARAGEQAGSWRVTGIWSHFACSDEPDHPANDAQERAFHDALAVAESAGLRPEVRHLANSAAGILRPSSRFDLVRFGLASYGLDPAPGQTPDLGLVPAMTVRAPLAMAKRIAAGAGVSYGHTWVADTATTVGLVPVGYGDGVLRARQQRRPRAGRRQAAGDPRPGVHGPVRRRPRRRPARAGRRGRAVRPAAPTASRPPRTGPRPRGTISYEIVTRIGGRLTRRYVD